MDKRTLSICVFCGSSKGTKPQYAEAARRTGALIGDRGHSLVFGGGGIGLMGEVARTVRIHGGNVIGILPEFLKHLEPPSTSAEELIITSDMQQRKAHMLSLSDAFVVLPGGLGTMDEIFEVLTTAQLHVHNKPIIVVNIDGYFAPLLALIAHSVSEGFARPEIENLFHIVATPDEAIDAVEQLSGIARAQARPSELPLQR